MEPETFVLTLEKVKDFIGFEPGTPIYITLNNACEAWYEHKKRQGGTDEESARYAFDRLGETLLSWGKEKNEQAS